MVDQAVRVERKGGLELPVLPAEGVSKFDVGCGEMHRDPHILSILGIDFWIDRITQDGYSSLPHVETQLMGLARGGFERVFA